MKNTILLNLVLILFIATFARAATRLVPDEYPTIQSAIDACVDGDVVIIAPDTYPGDGNRDIDFKGKAITVRSTDPNDPNVVAATIIDCNGRETDPHRGVTFTSGEGPGSIIAGLTITNGYASVGGGIYCNGSSPTITNCIITKNVAEVNGGGIMCYRDSSPAVSNCMIKDNSTGRGDGGGIHCMVRSSPRITSCLITGNRAQDDGGGIYCFDETNLIIINCTITANSAGDQSGGFYCAGGSPELINCIIWGNADSKIRLWRSTLTISHSDIEGGQPAIRPICSTLIWRQGNMDVNPEFVDANNGDFHLRLGSFCIDAGTNVPPLGPAARDLDGNPRYLDGDNDGQAIIDMGAYESLPADQPFITLSTWKIEFSAYEGGPNPDSQELVIRNGYGGIKTWTISYDCDWLDVNPAMGSLVDTNEVTLSADVSGLAPGVYVCNLTVSSPDAVNSPRTVTVVLHIFGEQVHVPSQFSTIQDAIDHVLEGGTVIVAPGTYTGDGNRDIDFKGKAISVRSMDPNDPNIVATTIIDCNGAPAEPHRGFYFHNGEDANSILDGLTITNGRIGSGGGILCENSSPTISNCTITANQATDGRSGGGVSCVNSSPIIANCNITNNNSYWGGGICSSGGISRITNCLISGNTAAQGGGIYCRVAHITNCTIVGNVGCGISSGPGNISNCIVWGNGTGDGPRGNGTGDGPQISGNWATAVSFSDIQGGFQGVGNIDADPCFVDPNAGDYHLSGYSPCINAGDPAYEPVPGETDIDGQPRVIDGWVDIGSDETPALTPIICVSPHELRFLAHEGGLNPASQTLTIRNRGSGMLNWELTEDCAWLHVHPTSGQSIRQIDDVNVSVDITGLVRGSYSCDLTITAAGAFNSPQIVPVILHIGSVLYVPSEYETIQDATDNAINGDTVIVADGTYTGDGNRDIDFKGKVITVRSENGPQNCIIDCNGAKDAPHRGFYFHSAEDVNSVLDGFTITNGYAEHGGGIYCEASSPTISNCTISSNETSYDYNGGGICCHDSDATIHNCRISNNTAKGVILCGGALRNGQGGGIYCYRRSPTIASCTIIKNVGAHGGGIYCYESSPTIRSCKITGNRATDDGGGISCRDSNPTISNCVISGNEGVDWYGGGGIYCRESSAIISNCTITSNRHRRAYGGGIRCYESSLRISNCILWDNIDRGGMDESAQIHGGMPVVNYCCIHGCTGALDGTGNIDAYPCFVELGYWDTNDTPTPWDDFWVAGDYHLLEDSPCIDTGDPNYIAEPNETDLDGKPRVIGGRIDMGAYEYSPPIPAEVRIVPRTINLASKGKWITCYIWLGEDYEVADIDANSVFLEGEIEVRSLLVDEQEQVAIVRFDRSEVQSALDGLEQGDVELTVSGELSDGTVFEGTDVIRVIDKGGKK